MHVGIPVGVHVLLEQGGRILLMRRAGTGFFDGLFSLPGGHVEAGESLRQTAVRELAEETGVAVTPAALEYVGVVHRLSDTNRIDFVLRAVSWRGEPHIREPHKCDAMQWVLRAALPSNTVPYVRAALAAGTGPWMLELGWA
jgi:8-oxo-dGTP diphosphatase